MSSARHGTRGQRVRAKRELLGEAARQYAHGVIDLDELCATAVEYSAVLDEPTREEALAERKTG